MNNKILKDLPQTLAELYKRYQQDVYLLKVCRHLLKGRDIADFEDFMEAFYTNESFRVAVSAGKRKERMLPCEQQTCEAD